MTPIKGPVTGNWYRRHDESRQFQVVSAEKDKDVIKIQYSDGIIQEMDFASWNQLQLHPCEAPET